MNPADIVRQLGGRWDARAAKGVCRCPAHDDANPSLSVRVTRDGALLLKCFAGCTFADVLAALRGMGADTGPPDIRPRHDAPAPDNDALARRIWREGKPIAGTPAETYLTQVRRVPLPENRDVLRYHPGLLHSPSGARLPAMLARMTDALTGAPLGIHRTYLRPDGSGKANVSPAKMMLGRAGVIRLFPDDDVTHGLGLAEGIETALAVTGCGWRPVWAALSAGAIARFPVLSGIEALTLFADADGPGLAAARECARRWAAAGREAEIFYPNTEKEDWNDITSRVPGRVL